MVEVEQGEVAPAGPSPVTRRGASV
eukprot:SAG11_NODE_14706_length_602_cov_1.504970_1_plen_24_part_10